MTIETLLVTGATGFVGSHVLEAYNGYGFRLRALVRKQSDAQRLEAAGIACTQGALEQGHTIRQALEGVDAVLHLAAVTKARTPGDYEQANSAGTKALIEAMSATEPPPKRLVYLSSLAAVGPSRDGRPVGPADAPAPLTAYGRSKLAGERLCTAVAEQFEVAILRAPAVYGPRDRDIFEAFRLAKFGIVPTPAGGPRRLQMIHAADLARALLAAVRREGARGVYHIAEARSYTWEEVAGFIAAVVGGRARVVKVPPALIRGAAAVTETVAALVGKNTIFNRDKARELLAPAWLCETELARRDFGFEAHIPLPAGLAETAQWYRQNGWL